MKETVLGLKPKNVTYTNLHLFLKIFKTSFNDLNRLGT